MPRPARHGSWETGWRVGLAYDFSNLGLAGVSGFTNFARGKQDLSDGTKRREELDFTID